MAIEKTQAIESGNNQEKKALQDIMKALKDGMLQKEQKNKLVDMINTPEQRHEILHLIQEDVQNHIESIITGGETTMWTHHDLLIMNLRHIMTEANPEIAGETKHQMIQKTETVVDGIVQHVSEKIGKNEYGNRNYYSDEQVMHIQLYANLVGNHNIPLDGKRGDIVNGQRQSGILFRLDAQTQEQQITNLYIYQKELAQRDIIMEQRPNESALLYIPNIDDMLDSIGNTALQEKVFQEFLDLFLHIRREGLYFENQIGGDVLQSVLIYMIHAAQYKETSIEDFFDATTQQDIIDSIKEQGYETMGAYFADRANTTKEEIMSINQENIASNQWLALMHTGEQIYQDIDAIEGEIALLLSPHQALAQERRNLANKLKENKITITEYYNALDRIAEKERDADQQMFDQQGRRKDILLRQQVIEKKIDLYTMHPTPDARMMICLELKQHFSNEDIQKFLDNPDIRSQYTSISYDKYHDAIQAREYELYNTDKEKNILQKRDAVNDIMSQYHETGIEIDEITMEEFQIHFPGLYDITNNHIGVSDRLGNQQDIKPRGIGLYKIKISTSSERMFVQNTTTEAVPPTKKDKKTIVIPQTPERTHHIHDAINIQFAYAHTDNEGNIIVEDLTGNIIKSISPQEQQEAQNTMNKAFLDVMHDYEINKTMRTFNQINERMGGFQHTMEQFRSGGFFANIIGKGGGISQEEKEIVLGPLENFAHQTARLQEDVSTRKNILGKLKSIQQHTSGIKNEFEQELEATVEHLESLISLFDNEGQKINQFIDMVSKIRENDTGWSALTAFWNEHGLSIGMAIGIAVGALATAKFTAGGSVGWGLKALGSLAMKNSIAVAATGTLGGMIGHRTGQTLNAWRINTFDSTFTNSTLQYRNPTDVEKYINGEVTGQEFVTNLAVEFALGTITTAAFIRAGQYVGNAIQKSNSSALKGTQDRIGRMVGYHKDLPPTARMSFTKDFVREFSQEVRQESIQGGAEQIGNQAGIAAGAVVSWFHMNEDGESNILGSLLSGLATIATCMGRGGYASTRRNLGITDSNNTYDRSNQQRIQHQTYDATNRQQLETLQTLYQEAGYSRIHIDPNTGVFRAERKVVEPLVKPNGDKIDTHIVEIAPSNAPSSVRALEHQLQDYQITIDHNSIEQIARYTDIADIQRLKTDIAMSNAGTIVVNQDGTVTLSIQGQTIQIKPQLEQHRDQIDNIIQQIESEQAIFNQPTVIEQAKTETEQLRLIDKIQLKIYNIAQAFTVESETELVTKGITYFAENIQHFLHECKMVFGTQLIDVYRSYHQWKANINKPGEAEFQTLFQHKLKERGTNLTKLIGLVTVSKVGIDPHLFFRSGHIMADQLQKHDNTGFFDKLFHLSFDTMNELYGRQEGSKQKYNPMTVIENSTLDNDTKQERLREILALDADNIQHQELLDRLIEAHEIGQNQPGANPAYTAGVYNYTTEQIRAKYSILKPYIDSGQITYEQVKQLFDLGYLGQNATNMELTERYQTIKVIEEKIHNVEGGKGEMTNFLQKINNKTYKIHDGIFDYIGLRDTFKKTLTMQEIHTLREIIAQDNNIDMNQELNVKEVLTKVGFGTQLDMQYNAEIVASNNSHIHTEGYRQLSPEQKVQVDNISGNIENYLNSLEANNGFISLEHKTKLREIGMVYAINIVQSSFKNNINNEGIVNQIFEFYNNLIFQEIGDKLIMAGSDHGIKHITNDTFGGLRLTDLMQDNGLFKNSKAIDARVMIIQIMMDHDMGYNMQLFERMSDKLGKGEITDRMELINALTDHPIFSAAWVMQNKAKYEAIYGEQFTVMRDAMIDHSNVRVENGPTQSPASTLLTKEMDFATKLKLLISIPDCLAAYRGDKGRELWSNQEMINHLHTIDQYDRMNRDIKDQIENLQKPKNIDANTEQKIQELKKVSDELNTKKEKIKQQMLQDIPKITQDPNKQKQYEAAIKNSFDVGDVKYPVKYNFGSYTGDLAGGGIQNSLRLVPMQNTNGEVIGYKPSIDVNIYQDNMLQVGEGFGAKIATSSIIKIMDDFGVKEIWDPITKNSNDFPPITFTIEGKQKTVHNGYQFYGELTNPQNIGKTLQIDGPSMVFNIIIQQTHAESAEFRNNIEKRIIIDSLNKDIVKILDKNTDTGEYHRETYTDKNGNPNRLQYTNDIIDKLRIENPEAKQITYKINNNMQKVITQGLNPDPMLKFEIEQDIRRLKGFLLMAQNENIHINQFLFPN